MARLTIALLGPPRISRGDEPVQGVGAGRALALLAYLAVTPDHPHRRETLAALLWPDQLEENARHSLRQALSTLRGAIGDGSADPPHLLVTRETVAFNGRSDHWLDVAEFSRLLDACRDHPHRHPDACAACAERLQRATDLYRGDFLAGVSLDESEELDEWLRGWRERLRARALAALDQLIALEERRGRPERARAAAERQLALDPWHEPAHRALIRLLAAAGERSAALAQYERCREALAEGLGVEPEPATTALVERIRTLPTAALATEMARRTGSSSPRPAGSPREGSLPAPPTPLIGRHPELRQVGDLLARRDCRLLTLVGPGGIGKTRLAIEVAAEQGGMFADGVAFVPLASVRAAAGLAPAVADALAIPMRGRGDPLDQLVEPLRERELLLVLDNMEHLLDGASTIAALLARTRRLVVLATSRERLHLSGEWIVAIDGLSAPGDEGDEDPARYDAVQLFVQSMERGRPGQPPAPEEWPAIARICHVVGGVPLALELAAAWLPELSPVEIAGEIGRGLDFLATPLRDLPARHQSMQAVFDQSWELLADPERAAFRRLAAFQGGFRAEAAMEVAGATPTTLATLVRKSLLRRGADERYESHELLRAYGEGKLREDLEEHRATRDRHASRYLGRIEEREADLTGHHQRAALAELTTEIENIRAAWRWATETTDVAQLVAAGHGLWLFYVVRGRMREGEAAFAATVKRLRACSGGEAILPGHDLALGAALIRQGGFASSIGQYDHAVALLDEGIVLLRRIGAPRELGLGLNFLAAVVHRTGDHQDEDALLRESLALFETSGDRWGAAYSLNDLGGLALHHGDLDRAGRLCAESLALFRAIDDWRGLALALANLGRVAAGAGDPEEATRLHRESLALRRGSSDSWGIAAALIELAAIARGTGELDRARHDLLDALRTAADNGMTPLVLETLVELGALALMTGEQQRAHVLLSGVLHHPARTTSIEARATGLLTELGEGAPALTGVSPLGATTPQAIEALVRDLLAEPAGAR